MKSIVIAACAALGLGACTQYNDRVAPYAVSPGSHIQVTAPAVIEISAPTTTAVTCVDPCGRQVAQVATSAPPRQVVQQRAVARPAQPLVAQPAVAAVPAPQPLMYLKPAKAPPGAVATTHAYWDVPQFDCVAHGGARVINPATGRPSCFMNHGPVAGPPRPPTN